ncbi:hypothetical protein MASR2M78_13690 [Treponema sp.]
MRFPSLLESSLAVCAVFIAASLASCSARYDLSLAADGSAELELTAALEPKTANLISTLSRFGGDAGGEAGLNAPALQQSLRGAPGIASSTLRNLDAHSLAGTISIADMDKFLSLSAASTKKTPATSLPPRFLSFNNTGSTGRFSLFLDLESGPPLLSLLAPEIVDYLHALMAPLATGEKLSRSEYLELVTAVYGKGISEEIKKANIHLTVDLPGRADYVKGGKAMGKKAEYTVSLLDALVLEQPLTLEATWK